MGNEIISTRAFAAPRELVWRAYSEPEHLANWWGPKGFTNTFQKFDFQPNGEWIFVMHGPDGARYPNQSVFSEIVEPERIAFRHLGSMHAFDVTITLTPLAAATEVTFRMRFDSDAECDRVQSFVVPANEENFDRLESELWRMG